MLSLLTSNTATIGALLGVVISLTGLVANLLTHRRGSPGSLTIWLSIGLSAEALLTSGYLRWLCASTGAICALAYQRWRQHQPDVPPSESLPTPLIFTILGIVSVSFVLLYRLGPEHIPVLVWEGTVILNYFQELPTLNLWKAFVTRLLWAQGLLSEGDRSLLYGFPTLYLLTLKSSLLSIRVFSVAYFLGATLCFATLCKRFCNPTIGRIALFTFGLNELGLVFGRYGSSIASTLFGVVIAFLACASLIARPSISRGIFAAFSLYIATLAYAPGRIVVLILLAMTVVGLLECRFRPLRLRIYVTLILCAGILLVCTAQGRFGYIGAFSYVRGEKFSTMIQSGLWPDRLVERWRAFRAENRPPNAADYLSFGTALVTEVTIPQMAQLLSPFDQAPAVTRNFSHDPLSLELYAKPLYPFMLVGILMVSRNASRWISNTLLAWMVVGCAPILLTNRVDSFRTSILIVPLAVWAAVGIAEAINEARRARVPQSIVAIFLVATVIGVTTIRATLLHFPGVSPSATELVITNLEPRFLRNATIGVENIDFRTLALTKIILLHREQHGMTNPATIIQDGSYANLIKPEPSEERTKALDGLTRNLTHNNPLILGPYNSVAPALEELSRRGFTVRPIRVQHLEVAFVVKE
jgi:hypothetical protein